MGTNKRCALTLFGTLLILSGSMKCVPSPRRFLSLNDSLWSQTHTIFFPGYPMGWSLPCVSAGVFFFCISVSSWPAVGQTARVQGVRCVSGLFRGGLFRWVLRLCSPSCAPRSEKHGQHQLGAHTASFSAAAWPLLQQLGDSCLHRDFRELAVSDTCSKSNCALLDVLDPPEQRFGVELVFCRNLFWCVCQRFGIYKGNRSKQVE